jgi:trafficking protein particle complex subunit 8
VSIISNRPASLKITHLNYSFLSLLPVSESLAVRGPRLHQTQAQRQSVVYGPDTVLTVDVEEGGCRLDLSLSRSEGDLRRLVLGSGECVELTLNVRNTGKGNVNDIWILHSSSTWLDLKGQGKNLLISAEMKC